jgi:hypothetical protein
MKLAIAFLVLSAAAASAQWCTEYYTDYEGTTAPSVGDACTGTGAWYDPTGDDDMEWDTVIACQDGTAVECVNARWEGGMPVCSAAWIEDTLGYELYESAGTGIPGVDDGICDDAGEFGARMAMTDGSYTSEDIANAVTGTVFVKNTAIGACGTKDLSATMHHNIWWTGGCRRDHDGCDNYDLSFAGEFGTCREHPKHAGMCLPVAADCVLSDYAADSKPACEDRDVITSCDDPDSEGCSCKHLDNDSSGCQEARGMDDDGEWHYCAWLKHPTNPSGKVGGKCREYIPCEPEAPM